MILAQHLLVSTILIILCSIIIKTLFPSLELKFGIAFPKAIKDYQSTCSKQKGNSSLTNFVPLETLYSSTDTRTGISEIKNSH